MIKSLDAVLCAECRSLQPYDIVTEISDREWNGSSYKFNKKIAICRKCGNRVSVPGLHDLNEKAFDIKCRTENNYILIDEIKEILKKYDIDKRPLSRVLGLGEHTIENYLKGQLPSKRYSDMLRNILENYECMQCFLDENWNKLTERTAKKLSDKLKYYSNLHSHDTLIETLALYILLSKYEINNKSLQKLLYYIEAFVYVLLRKQLFEGKCEAWSFGPVYPEIYEKYKIFGDSSIVVDKVDLADDLAPDIREIADYVLEQFAIFNGETLTEICRSEEPWKNAHQGYDDKESCSEIITHESIHEYFSSVNEQYNLSNKDQTRNYILSLGVI